jgi:multiple antibiotic resistance protein
MKEFLFMLVILNPFAQALYLANLMNHMKPFEFIKVHLRALVLTYGVFILFALIGENVILKQVFQVRLASLQIFGGIVMLIVAYRYIIIGPESNLLFNGDVSKLAQEISLPYMIGPGTIWVSILIGRKFDFYIALAIIAAVLIINFTFIISYQQIYHRLGSRKETILGKYFGILMRTNALFIGAIAVEMLIVGMEGVLTDYGIIGN